MPTTSSDELDDVMIGRAVRLFEPPPVLSVSEWADAERMLPGSSAARGARYRTDTVPYLREPMDRATDPATRRLVGIKAHQTGFSEALHNILGYHMHHRPCPMLLVMPTSDIGKSVAKERIGDMIRSSAALRAVVQHKRSAGGPLNDPESTLNMILYAGGFLAIGGANTPNTFARVAARIAIGDDVDRWPAVVIGKDGNIEGDPADLLENRTTTFHDGRTLFVSTPTMKGARIDSLYALSDQRRYHVTCPACGRHDWITWSDPTHFRVTYDDRNPVTARLECPACHHAIRESDRRAIVRAGAWQPTASASAGHLGYHIPAMLSPFVTMPGLVEKWLEAQRKGRESLRGFINTSLAEPWEDEDRTIHLGSEEGLMGQRERYEAIPPPGSVVMAALDVQEDRFEALFAAFGRRDEMWVLHHEVLARDDGFDPYDRASWEKLYRVLADVRFDHACGAKLPVHTLCIDSGFQTQQAYRFARFSPRRIFATKGVKELPERNQFIRFSTDTDMARHRGRGGVPLVLVGTDLGKQRVADRLRDGRIHFPAAQWCGEEFFAQLTAETCEPVLNPAGVRVGQKWVKQRARNEILDLVVLCLAAKAIRGTLDLDAYRAQMGLPSVEGTS